MASTDVVMKLEENVEDKRLLEKESRILQEVADAIFTVKSSSASNKSKYTAQIELMNFIKKHCTSTLMLDV
jgi:hypothetical protein